jgi:hypothetical protein
LIQRFVAVARFIGCPGKRIFIFPAFDFTILPMMIPIIDIPDLCDVKHWVLRHMPLAPLLNFP